MENTLDPLQSIEHKAKVMRQLYPDAKEDVHPRHMPEPRGASIQLNCFVDASHAGDKMTRHSHTGILIYGNMAPLIWYSKRQNTIELSTFGAKFVALRIASEMIISLRYKLRMFGIPIDGPCNIFCDNEAVYKNVANPESTLKKKHLSICYHKVQETIASGCLYIYHENTGTNHADMFTKILDSFTKSKFVSYICGNIRRG